MQGLILVSKTTQRLCEIPIYRHILALRSTFLVTASGPFAPLISNHATGAQQILSWYACIVPALHIFPSHHTLTMSGYPIGWSHFDDHFLRRLELLQYVPMRLVVRKLSCTATECSISLSLFLVQEVAATELAQRSANNLYRACKMNA